MTSAIGSSSALMSTLLFSTLPTSLVTTALKRTRDSGNLQRQCVVEHLRQSPRIDVQIFDNAFRNALFLPVLQEPFQRGALELFRKSYSKLLDVFSDFFPHFTRVCAAFSKVGCIQLKPLEGQ